MGKPNNGNGSSPKRVRSRSVQQPKATSLLPMPTDLAELLQRLGNLGLANAEIATVFGLSTYQFEDFLLHNPALYDVLQTAKEVPNRKVEASLYKRALGYQVQEVHKVEGKPSKVIVKEIAPDVVADIFWLKNRDPKRWRDTLEISHSLRDRFDRAHMALRLGQGSGPLALPDGKGEEGDGEA